MSPEFHRCAKGSCCRLSNLVLVPIPPAPWGWDNYSWIQYPGSSANPTSQISVLWKADVRQMVAAGWKCPTLTPTSPCIGRTGVGQLVERATPHSCTAVRTALGVVGLEAKLLLTALLAF